jgi:tetratricopeptide (TPR) repeat protein
MGKLDWFFEKLRERRRRSDAKILDELDEALFKGDFSRAVELIHELESDQNVIVAVRILLKKIMDEALEMKEEERPSLIPILKEVIPIINGIQSERYRALLLGDLALAFYYLGVELEGDLALKAAINIALRYPEILRDILFSFIRSGLVEKAAYAMRLIKDPEQLDIILSYLAEVFYERGEKEKALSLLDFMACNFHRAVTLMHFAQYEKDRDREKALELVDKAIGIAEKIDDADARFELMLKLHDLRHEILGEPLTLTGILSKETPSGKREGLGQGGRKGGERLAP